MTNKLEQATLGGGCFWCLEAIYQDIKGVESVVSGYAGGPMSNPTYQQVCSGTTGHAEVVQITYDSDVISYEELLFIFWRIHDPTTINRQGADVGTQYRSIILYHNDAQHQIAEQSKTEANNSRLWPTSIVTEIAPLKDFYPAESYHQNYYKSNPNQPYCRVVIDPKVRKFKKEFQDRLNQPA
jgi:peptide-methionine (S)-S-oxide reductase